jgi:hypothetical protein
LLIRTNESVVPWDLLHDGEQFLGDKHPMGRHSITDQRATQGRTIGRIGRALVVGDPLGDLPAARAEAEHVTSWLTAKGTTCHELIEADAKLSDVVMKLHSGRHDLLHYSGHVAPSPNRGAALVLHGPALLDEPALQTMASVGVPPVVFLNGCAAADSVTNLCFTFMLLGAKTVVGTRYDVKEFTARRFAEEFYGYLLAGTSAGEAVRLARLAVTGAADAGWSAYFLYGNPTVTVAVGDKSRAEQPLPLAPARPTAEADETPPLDPRAQQLMAQVRELAAPHRVVTSMDLLIGLLTHAELRAWAVAAIGERRLEMLAQLLTMLVSGTVMGTGTQPVKYSDTVQTVLTRAGAFATEAGRGAVTTHDLSVAFLDVGGGSSAYVVEQFGLSIADLKPVPVPPTGSARPAAPVQVFGPDGRLRLDQLSRPVADALRVALVVASAGKSVISTSALLVGFGVAGSEVLRRCLAEQGEAGARAIKALFLEPKDRHFSPRTRQMLEHASPDGRGLDSQVGEVALLRAVLADEQSSAHEQLRAFGIDTQRLLRALPA